jgi:hypothetical protein
MSLRLRVFALNGSGGMYSAQNSRRRVYGVLSLAIPCNEIPSAVPLQRSVMDFVLNQL